MTEDLQRLADACTKAAEHYCSHPEQVGAAAVIDIYRTLGAFASLLAIKHEEAPPRKSMH
jgi:hypothetical protein